MVSGDGIGAMISVTPDLANPTERMVWEIDGGGGFLGQNERTAHFGPGESSGRVDLVTVEWPTGNVRHRLFVATKQTIRLRERGRPIRAFRR